MAYNSAFSQNAKSHLLAGIVELEREASDGHYNHFTIRSFGNVAKLLSEVQIAVRAVRLLNSIPNEKFWAGAIANFELPEIVPDSLRSLESDQELEKSYPLFSLEKIINDILSAAENGDNEHLALCISGRVQEARSVAGSGRMLEEVGDTLAVLGDFEGALSISRDLNLEPFRQKGVQYIMMIEQLRLGNLDEAAAISMELCPINISATLHMDLALTCANRMPWISYPFPDW